MKRKIISIFLIMIVVLFLAEVDSNATVSASSQTVNSGENVTITIRSSELLSSYQVTVTDEGGLSYVSCADSNGGQSGNKTIAGSPSNGANQLGTFTFKAPSVSTDTEYTVKFSATAMDTTDLVAVPNAYPNAKITVKAPVSNNSGNSSSTSSGNSNNSSNNSGGNTSTVKSSYNKLSNLGIRPHDFIGFNADVTEYNVTVPNDTTEINVYADINEKKAINAKISGIGKKQLKEGINTFIVTCTAENGKKRDYTLNITRETTTPTEQEPEQELEAEPEEETPVEEKVLGISQIKITGTTGDEKSVELTFTPEFNSDIYEYTTIVPVEIKDINVEAKASIEDAAIEVMGNKDLVLGENVITILVKSADGTEQKSYQIIVTKTTESLKQDHTELIKKIIIITTITILVIAIIIAITVFKRGKKSQKIGTIGRDISIADEMLGKEDQEIKKEEKPSSNDGNHGKRFK